MNLKKRFNHRKESFCMNSTDPDLIHSITEKVTSWLPASPMEYVVVCIGTDRSTGDALGPLTGTYLLESKPRYLSVYGTIDQPVHASNLDEYVTYIQHKHQNPFIIAIDAALGKSTSVGSFIIGEGALKPGAALKKPLPEIGNVYLTGVVNVGGFMEYSVLQNTRLSVVIDMAKKTAAILDQIDRRLHHIQPLQAAYLPNTAAAASAAD